MANNSLKEIICANLTHTLSTDKNVRDNAEQQLIMLETNQDYGLHLMEISLSENIDFTIRHLASVLLNRYIVKHWCDSSEQFEPPEVPAPVKQVIREYLLKALMISANEESQQSSVRRLSSSFANAVSNIAQTDWPVHWPQLFPTLNQYLVSNSPNAIHSSLKVFKELANEITDTQMADVAPILLPQMFNIFVSTNFTLRTRTDAIRIFGIISETIILMDEYHPNSIRLFLGEYIPEFTKASIHVLKSSQISDDVDVGLKKEIISIMTKFLEHCPVQMKGFLPKILELIWQHLTTSAHLYVKHRVNSNSGGFNELNNAISESVDSDGENIGFDSFIYTLFDFVSSIFDHAKYRELIKPVLCDLLYYIIYYVQITDEQAENWKTHLDLLMEEDDIDSASYSIRIAAQDLILNLSKKMTTTNARRPKKDDELFKLALYEAIQRHFSEASDMEKRQKCNGTAVPQTWWKVVEACLYSLGLLAPTIIYTINSGTGMAGGYKRILDDVLLNLNPAEPLMAGRSLWTASRFSKLMNDQSLDKFLKLTSDLLNNTQTPILRVYALRATFYFFLHVQINQRASIVKPYMPQFLQGLISIGMNCNSDTLDLVLQIVDMLLDLDGEFTRSILPIICTILISTLFRFPDDAATSDTVLSIVDRLYSVDRCLEEARERILPIIVVVLNAQLDDTHLASMGLNQKLTPQSVSVLQPQILDILTKTIDRPNGVNDFIVQKAYPALLNCIAKASKDNSAIFQNACECLCSFLKHGSDYVAKYVDPATNQNGVMLAFNVCTMLLNSQMSDSASASVGRVIVMLIIKCNHLISMDNCEHLLRSTLVRLNTSKQLPIIQNLILVFAHLIYLHFSNTLRFLNSLPAPDGTKSALEFVLNKWLGVQRYYYGYETKASTLALCKLFQHALRHQQPPQTTGTNDMANPNDLNPTINLHHVMVSCDDEFDSIQTARTRSQTRNKAIRLVPCTVKMLKLLINELSHIEELKVNMKRDLAVFDEDEEDSDSDSVSDDDDDDDDNHDANDSSLVGDPRSRYHEKPMIDLTKLLIGDDDINYSQNEILCEEINEIDLETQLRALLNEFRQSSISGEFVGHLTPAEATFMEKFN